MGDDELNDGLNHFGLPPTLKWFPAWSYICEMAINWTVRFEITRSPSARAGNAGVDSNIVPFRNRMQRFHMLRETEMTLIAGKPEANGL